VIPEETIDQVREATDIAQIIGQYLRLKKRGKNHIALCPFHTEKTPSFNVNSERQIFHCFGCGKGGNVFTFLMEHERMTFVEVVQHLAQRANIPIREDRGSDQRREKLERINYANQIALDYFCKVLHEQRYESILNDYLIKRRGITKETIDEFQLGLTGPDWDGLIKYAATKDLSAEELMQSGLALKSEKTGNYFDRFRQRLMIPILSLSQKPIAFGGRTLKKGEPAKYVNSPETALYIKSNVLYGLNFSRDDIRKANTAIVVEGYFDVISLWQVGIRNVVASSGTAFTEQQARLLARFADEVYLFFDADSAGRTAALRSVDLLYDAGLEVKVIVAPEGEDPDSLALDGGRDRIEELQADALDYIQFRMQDVDRQNLGIIGKEKLVKELAAVASRIGDATRRDLFTATAVNALGVTLELFKHNVKPATAETPRPAHRRKHDARETELLSLLFLNSDNVGKVFEQIAPDDFDSKELSRLYAAMANQFRQHGSVNAAALISGQQDAEFVTLVVSIAELDWPDDAVDEALSTNVAELLMAKRRRLIARLQKELQAADNAGDHEKADRLLREIKNYTKDAE
jgi:DNA primase